MKSAVGVFADRKDAVRAVERLRSIGVPEERITLLAPGAGVEELEDVPTTDTEGPGMGKAVGGAVGAGVGASLGVLAAPALLLPGVGPVVAVGVLGASILGGILGGAAVGATIERSLTDGIPVDELHVYEDALRQGKSVVVALLADVDQAARAREMLERAGAESLDAARERWWTGLKPAEAQQYRAPGRDFARDEAAYRRGFEAAQLPAVRGLGFEAARERLRAGHGDALDDPAFRAGFERGAEYRERVGAPAVAAR